SFLFNFFTFLNSKTKAEDLIEQPSKKKVKFAETENGADSQEAAFRKKYVELHELGRGLYGTVFAGYRQEDELPVAIKHISKKMGWYNHKDENGRKLPMEVAVMLKLRDEPVRQPSMVHLLDWYNLDQEMILVMERPVPCDNLSVYLVKHKPLLKEKDAKIIVKQLVKAAIYLHSLNIFHRDIRLDNILIRTDLEEPKVYLIDFGISSFLERKHDQQLDSFSEVIRNAEIRTVWQVGTVLFKLVHNQALSQNCQDFMTKSRFSSPKDYPSMEDLFIYFSYLMDQPSLELTKAQRTLCSFRGDFTVVREFSDRTDLQPDRAYQKEISRVI
uniref:non-specific serine/threonine protein kinase n=1 Tax=Cyprinodon variegatus TaxID=28743 RepID=A0A3Q2GI91_CYPVA